MNILKYYILPFAIAIILASYGFLEKKDNIMTAGISLFLFLIPALIGSIIGKGRKNTLKSRYLLLIGFGVIAFVVIHLITNSYWWAFLALFLVGAYFLYDVIRSTFVK